MSFATQAQRLIPLRVFFKWLARENHILSNPASEFELPRVHRRLPAYILSREQVEQVMALTRRTDEQGHPMPRACGIAPSWKPSTPAASAVPS